MLRIIIVLSILLLTFSCSLFADEYFDKPKWGKIANWEWEYQPPEEYVNAEAVVLFDMGRVEVELRGTQFKRYLRMKIFKPENLIKITTHFYRKKDFRDIYISYYLSPESTYTPKEQTFDENKSYQWCFAEKTIEKVQEQGFILELEYIIDYDSTYLPEWYFDNKWFTLNSTYQVSIGGSYNYSYWSENLPGDNFDPIRSSGGGLVGSFYSVLNWRLNNIQPFDFGNTELVRREISPIVYFKLRFHGNTTMSNQETYTVIDNAEIAAEIVYHMEDYLKKSNGAKTLANKAIAGIENKYDKAAAIYNSVCVNIETLPSLKIEEYSKIHLKKMIESGKGTVLEKSYLLIKMLDKIDIEAWPVLIATTDYGTYNIQNPDPRQFNHILVRAEINQGEFVFCDISQSGIAFGELPERSKVSGGLLIHDKKPSPVRVQ